jgi:hypothetical protein
VITVLALSAVVGVYTAVGFGVVALIGFVAHQLRHEEPYEYASLFVILQEGPRWER